MRILFVLLFTCFGLNSNVISSNELLERNKRFIIFPYGGSYKLVIGIGIPVMLAAKHKTLVFASNIQFQYPQITNLTQVQQDLPPLLTRKRRFAQGQSEWTVTYLALEALMDKYNINGKTCLLRSICENAMYSLHHDSNGLYGQLLHIILTPNYGINDTDSDADLPYMEAKMAGEFGIDCLSMYPDCPLGHSLLDLISILE